MDTSGNSYIDCNGISGNGYIDYNGILGNGYISCNIGLLGNGILNNEYIMFFLYRTNRNSLN